MKRRTIVAIVLGLITISLVSSLRSTGKSGTTFSTKPEGAQALFDLYLEAGFEPERWFYPFSELEGIEQNSLMIIVAPETMTGVEQLLRWVSRGNTLAVFEESPEVTAPLREKLHLATVSDLESIPSLFNPEESPALPFYCPAEKFEICGSVAKLSTRFPQPRYRHLGTSDVLLGYENGAKGLLISHEQGTIFWFTRPEPALNKNLDLHDNALLLYGLARSSQRILIDEFHHGYTAPLVGEAARRTEVIYAFIACLAFWLFLGAASRFIRFGSETPRILPNSSAGVDFVSVLGLLYEDRRAASLLRKYVLAWRKKLARSLGVGADLPIELLVEECTRRGLAQPSEIANLKLALQELSGATDYSDRSWLKHILVLERFAKQILGRMPHAQPARNAA